MIETPQINGANGHARPLPNGGLNGLRGHSAAPSLEAFTVKESGVPKPRFTFTHPADIRLTAREWTIPGLLPRRGIGVLFGPSGCGKSFLAVDLGLRIAGALIGVEYLNRRIRHGGVIYCAAEDAEGVKYRTAAWIKAYEGDADIPFAIVSEAPDLCSDDDADTAKLIAAIQEHDLVMREKGGATSLVIIDTLRDSTPGMEENSSTEMSRVMKTLRTIGRDTGAFVLVVHHTSKGGDGEDPRGSSALIGAADAAFGLKVEKDPESGTVSRSLWMRKQRNGPDANGDSSLRWAYSLRPVDLDVLGEDGEPEQSCIVELTAAEKPPSKPAKLSPAETIVWEALIGLLSEGAGQRPPADIPCPRGQEAVRKSDLMDRARARGLSESASKNPDEAARRAFGRALEKLAAIHKANVVRDWVWVARS